MTRTIFFSLFLLLSLSLPAVAQKKSRQVRRLENQRKEILQKIKQTDQELTKTRTEKRNGEKMLKLVERQVAQRTHMVELLDQEVDGLQVALDSFTRKRDTLLKQEDVCKRQYAKSVMTMQRRSLSVDRMLFLFSSEDFNTAFRRKAFLEQYAVAHSKAAEALKQTRSLVEKNRQDIAETHTRKSNLLAMRAAEKKKLESEKQQRSSEIKKLSGRQKNLEQLLRKQKSTAAALNRKIEQQIAIEIAEAERKAREERERLERKRATTHKSGKSKTSGTTKYTESETATAPTRRAAVKGGYAMNAEERALSADFASNRGRLPAPVRGRYDLVGQYGVHSVQGHNRVQTSSGGIDLRVSGDRRAYSVFNGVVTSVFAINGFNNSVIIRHGNYLTVYSNLSSVSVSKGQKVSTGQIIGQIATDADTQETILHFQIWKERSKQNPSSWIR